jgi:molybdenum cofactor biosynthesis enzyme
MKLIKYHAHIKGNPLSVAYVAEILNIKVILNTDDIGNKITIICNSVKM